MDQMLAEMPGFAAAADDIIGSSDSSSSSDDDNDDLPAGIMDLASVRARAAEKLQRPASANHRARRLGLAMPKLELSPH